MSYASFFLFFKKIPVRCKGTRLFILLFFLFGGTAHAQQGLKAEYYDGTNFDRLVAVRYVANIDQHWNRQPPVPGINPHRCSIRWSGQLRPGKSGRYQFAARVDDGIRVWVDDQLIIDQWGLNDVGIFQGTVDLVAHREYKLKVEYFNALVEGEVRLLWRIPGEKKSWYERWFGDDQSFTVIAPEYFLRPAEPGDDKEDALVIAHVKVPQTAAKKKTKVSKPDKTKPGKKKQGDDPGEQATVIEKADAAKVAASIKEAEKYLPKNIEFEQARTIILESSYQELNTFAQFMLDHPHLQVMIEGHTDPVGDAAMNLQLSKRRAFTIARYLVDKGIDKSRIKAEGYGGSRPLVVPEEGSYYPANRRVVFVVSGLSDQ